MGRQRGIALLLFVLAVVLGIAVLTFGALSKAAVATADREVRTGLALKAAKDAVLAYVAQTAASTTELYPGRLPCPEVRSQTGTANDGVAGPFTGPAVACDGVGRLPWKTLGIDQLRDGYDEPLWYVVPTGTWAWLNTNDLLTINPGLANQITYDGTANAVVAVIVAPGPPINNLSETSATKPAACAKVNQTVNRYVVPYSIANFLECDNATGSYTTVGPTTIEPGPPRRTVVWSNDRTISITAAEVMDAISGAVADRLQRQVAPALNDWRVPQSAAIWGTSFLPYASTFTLPASNDLCGDLNAREGILPVAAAATSTCTSWSGAGGTWSINTLGGSLFFPSCSQTGTSLDCTFFQWIGPLSTRITATAPAVAMSFRAPITSASITNNRGGANSNFSLSLSSATGQATVSVDVTFPLLAFFTMVTVSIPNLPDAAILSDPRMTWYVNNQWSRYTYYTVAPGAKIGAASPCSGAGDVDCLTVTGLPASNGFTDDKQFVLTLMGRAVSGQTQPSAAATNYLELHTVGTTTFATSSVTPFNDRQAACPFQQTPATGPPVAIC